MCSVKAGVCAFLSLHATLNAHTRRNAVLACFRLKRTSTAPLMWFYGLSSLTIPVFLVVYIHPPSSLPLFSLIFFFSCCSYFSQPSFHKQTFFYHLSFLLLFRFFFVHLCFVWSNFLSLSSLSWPCYFSTFTCLFLIHLSPSSLCIRMLVCLREAHWHKTHSFSD